MQNKEGATRIEGNNNIVLKNIDGSTVKITVNDTEQIIAFLSKWEKQMTDATKEQVNLLQRNIALLEKTLDDTFQALDKEEFNEDIVRFTSRFIGRSEEIQEIKDFVKTTKEGMFFIFGSPGIGKSSLSAKVIDELQSDQLAQNEETLRIIPYFIRRGTESAQVNSLLSYLNQQVEDFIETDLPIDKNTNNLRAGLHQRLKKAGDYLYSQKIVLFIDGLDEGTDNGILDHLLRNTYSNVLIVYSGRYTDEVENFYHQCRNLTNFRELRLKGLPDEIVDEIIQKILEKHPISEALIPHLISNSQGNPKYLELLELSLEKGIIQLTSNADIPKFTEDFDNFYAPLIKSYIQHEYGNYILPCLYTISVAKDYLNTIQLRKILNLEQADIGKAIFVLNEVLITKVDSRNNEYYQLFHESLRDYLRHKEYYQLLESMYSITDFCKGWETHRGKIFKEYPAKYYADHLFDLIQEEEDKLCKEELFGLTENKGFVDLQIDLTEQFHFSFDLFEKSIRVALADEAHRQAMQFSLGTVDLYQRQNSNFEKLVEWAKSGLQANVMKALSMLEAIPVEKKIKAYAVLLYHNLFGEAQGIHDQKKVCQTIVDHLDKNLDKGSNILQPFRYWFVIYRECRRLGIEKNFLRRRIDFVGATEANPNHEKKWSYFEEFVFHSDLSNDTELDIILEFMLSISNADSTDQFGFGFTLFLSNLEFTARQLKEAGLMQKVSHLEELVLRQVKKLEFVKSAAAKTVSLDRAKCTLIDIALLKEDEEKAHVHWQSIHDRKPTVAMGIKVAKRFFDLGKNEVGERIMSKVVERGSSLMSDKTDGLKFLGQMAELSDKVPLLNGNTVHFLRKAFEILQSSRVKSRDLKAVLTPLQNLQNLPFADLEYFICQALQKNEMYFDFDRLKPKLINKLFENGGTKSLSKISHNYSAVEFMDVLFPLYEELVEAQNYEETHDLLSYFWRQLERVKEEFSSTKFPGQEFRFKLKVGALKLSYDLAGMDLVQEALDIQVQDYVSSYIVMSTYVYAFPFVYQFGDKQIGEQLMNKAINAAVAELDNSGELNLFRVVKGLIKCNKSKEALRLFQLLIKSTEIDLYTKELIEEFVKADCLDLIADLELNESVLNAISSFVNGKHKEKLFPMINGFFETDLIRLEPISILDEADVKKAYYTGVLSSGEDEVEIEKAKAELENDEAFIRKSALENLEIRIEKVAEITEKLGNGYSSIVYNIENEDWEGVRVEGYTNRELREKTTELGLYGSLAYYLFKKGGLDLVKGIPELATDPKESERIARIITRWLLREQKYAVAADWIREKLSYCRHAIFWQDAILGFSQDVNGLYYAEEFLEKLGNSRDSSLANKLLESHLDFVSKLVLYQKFEDVMTFLNKIRGLTKDSEQARNKAETICQLVGYISANKKVIKSQQDLSDVLMSLSEGREKTLFELRRYAPLFLFYLGRYDDALSMAKEVENGFFKDFHILRPLADQLIWRGELDTAISFALEIEDDNNKMSTFEMAIEKLANQGDITRAITLIKKVPDFESEELLIERIIDACQQKDLPVIKQFLFEEISNAPEKIRFSLWRYFLLKAATFPSALSNWIDQTLVSNLHNLDNLTTILYLEYLTLPKEGNDSFKAKVRNLLDIGVKN